jgi:hypothetical protein
MRSGKPDPLAAHIVHVCEDRRNAADVVAEVVADIVCRLSLPRIRVQIFDKHLVHALIGSKDPGCGPPKLSVKLGFVRLGLVKLDFVKLGLVKLSLTNFGLTNFGLTNFRTNFGLTRGHGSVLPSLILLRPNNISPRRQTGTIRASTCQAIVSTGQTLAVPLIDRSMSANAHSRICFHPMTRNDTLLLSVAWGVVT